MKIIDYEILGDIYTGSLEKKVVEYMLAGWQPLGGISHSGVSFFQAMVKYEEPPMQPFTWTPPPFTPHQPTPYQPTVSIGPWIPGIVSTTYPIVKMDGREVNPKFSLLSDTKMSIEIQNEDPK